MRQGIDFLRFAGAALLIMIAAPHRASSGDFYEAQLLAGQQAFAAKNYVEANDALRIAAFGFLDRPAMLDEALAYLALTQSFLGQSDAADETIERFLVVEARFPSWVGVTCDQSVREQFEALLRARAGSRLATVPALAPLLRSDEKNLATTRPRERNERAPDAAVSSSPSVVSSPPTRSPAPVVTTETSATASLARVTTAIREGQQLVAAHRYRQAEQRLYDAIVKDPGSRELRLVLLEAATLAGDWKTAESQLPIVMPLADREARSLFYAAVVWWELGKREEARTLANRARPGLPRSPYVDQYLQVILGK